MANKNDKTIEFDFEGLKEIDKLLEKLPIDVQASILKSLNRKGAKIVMNAMQSAAPSTGIKDSIKIKSDKYNKTGVLVGVTDTEDSYYARFIEYGTESRETKAGANRGEMVKKPFIKGAIDQSIQDALNLIKKEYASHINKSLERRVKALNKKLSK